MDSIAKTIALASEGILGGYFSLDKIVKVYIHICKVLGTQEGHCEHKMACYGPKMPLSNSLVKAWTAGTSEYETEHLKVIMSKWDG